MVASVVGWPGIARAALHWLVEQGAPVGSHSDVQYSFELMGDRLDRGTKDWLLGLVTAEAAPGEEA